MNEQTTEEKKNTEEKGKGGRLLLIGSLAGTFIAWMLLFLFGQGAFWQALDHGMITITPESDGGGTEEPVQEEPYLTESGETFSVDPQEYYRGKFIDTSSFPTHTYAQTEKGMGFTLYVGIDTGTYNSSTKLGTKHFQYVPSDDWPVTISLVNYEDSSEVLQFKQVVSSRAWHSCEILLPVPHDGLYYYALSCDGYQTTVPDTPFFLKKSESEEDTGWQWFTHLRKYGTVYGKPFQVHVVYESDLTPLSDGIVVRLRTESLEPDEQRRDWFVVSPKTDRHGYLSNNTTFQLAEEYQLQYSMEDTGDNSKWKNAPLTYTAVDPETPDIYVIKVNPEDIPNISDLLPNIQEGDEWSPPVVGIWEGEEWNPPSV